MLNTFYINNKEDLVLKSWFFVGTRGNQRDDTWTEPKGCHMDGTKGMSHGRNQGMSHGQNQRDVTWTEPKGCHMDLILYR